VKTSAIYHGGASGRGAWPGGGGGSGLPPAVVTALTSPDALPILQAIAEGCLAVKDKTNPVTQPRPGYDLIYNDNATGATYIEYPNAAIDLFDLTQVNP
jgi:hypothetical protein